MDQLKENKMGTMSISKLVIAVSFPLMLSMLTQALYNIVDSMFVSYIGENALTAVSLAYPVQNLMVAFAVGTGVGVNAVLSKRLGQKRFDEANNVAKHAFFLAACNVILFILLGYFFIEIYYKSQTNNADILKQSLEYTNIVVYGSIGLFGVIASNRLLQSTGKTVYVMITQMSGVVINLILDPILIFGLCGFPQMNIAGAALATIIGQIGSMGIGLYFNLTKNKELNLSLRGFKPNGAIIMRIYSVGIPSIIMSAIGSVMVYFVNLILAMFSTTAIAVFGIFFKLNGFAVMPVFGLNNGIIPIIAYNYGAKNKERITQTMRFSIMLAFIITFLSTAVFLIFPAELLGFFNPSQEMLEIGVPALRILALNFLIAGIAITFSGIFQAFGNGMFSMILSIVRQLVVIVPVAFLLAQTGKLINVWWAIPLAEIVGLIVSSFFMVKIKKNILDKMQ